MFQQAPIKVIFLCICEREVWNLENDFIELVRLVTTFTLHGIYIGTYKLIYNTTRSITNQYDRLPQACGHTLTKTPLISPGACQAKGRLLIRSTDCVFALKLQDFFLGKAGYYDSCIRLYCHDLNIHSCVLAAQLPCTTTMTCSCSSRIQQLQPGS